MSNEQKGWIGVDLDGTLAEYDKWRGLEHIGEPVPAMVARVKEWIANGETVKVFTARAGTPEAIPVIKAWLAKHGLPDLEVTNVKESGMFELWDDRCVQVEPNQGVPVGQAATFRLGYPYLVQIDDEQETVTLGVLVKEGIYEIVLDFVRSPEDSASGEVAQMVQRATGSLKPTRFRAIIPKAHATMILELPKEFAAVLAKT